MAYALQYTTNFTNELGEDVAINIYKKDGTVPTQVVNYAIASCEINTTGQDDDILDIIISRELLFALNIPFDDTAVDWQTFIASANDDWKVIATIDGQFVFHGFIVPDESPTDFQDKPYQLTIRCTDGLKLLSQITLTNAAGNPFDCASLTGNVNTLMSYVVTCLSYTNLGLPIRFYCNIYESSMLDRFSDVDADAFNQAMVERRAFAKSPTEMMNCSDVLTAIFQDHFKLFYWNGFWVIFRIPEYQYSPGGLFYTLYNPDGTVTPGTSQQDTEDFAAIGKSEIIYPVNEDQQVASRFALKSVEHEFKYNVWDEIPANSKFDRGTLNTGVSTPTEKYYSIDCWTFAKTNFGNYPVRPNLTNTTGTCFRKSTLNTFGVETMREIVITPEDTSPTSLYDVLESERIPVDFGDIIDISLSFHVETAAGMTGTDVMKVYIIPDDGSPIIQMDNSSGVLTDKIPWVSGVNGLKLQFAGADPTQYAAFTATSLPIPKTGKMVISFYGHNRPTFGKWFYKDFQLTYTPYVAGGYIPITGDYWVRTNPLNYLDTLDNTLGISDSLKKIIKGALLRANGLDLTTMRWYRFGLTEKRHYKELVNLGVYNLKYRRFWKITGSFKGTKFAPNNNSGNVQPIGSHRLYRFVDIAGVNKDFVLCTPWRLDVTTGIFNGTFIEVHQDSADGTQEPAAAIFTYTFST